MLKEKSVVARVSAEVDVAQKLGKLYVWENCVHRKVRAKAQGYWVKETDTVGDIQFVTFGYHVYSR